jgi:3-hydroxyisobutyrate dehydrogenase-like beta-hydroxyacid dehydrogenase
LQVSNQLTLALKFSSEIREMNIAFLGMGKMGQPMARRLLADGHDLTVWNRSRWRAEALAENGAAIAPTANEAVRSADVLMTMLFDDAAHEEVLLGAAGALDVLKPGALHISLSTISVALSESLTAEHARRNQFFVAAPVFGRPNVAEEGRLWIVGAGEDAAIVKAKPLLKAFSRGISIVGNEPRQAHALKLGGNFLISAMIHGLSESFVFAESQGIEPQKFLEAVNAALFQSPFYAAYGSVMLNPPDRPGATIELGAKDLRLLRDAAAERNVRLSLADNLAEIFAQAQQSGLGSEDWAVGQYRMAQRRGALSQ